MSDDLTCNPLPISIVEGWARVCLENMAGYEPEAWRTVRRVPRVDVEAAIRADRERRAAGMGANVRPWRVAR